MSDAVREGVAVGAGVDDSSLVSVWLALGVSVRTVVLVDNRLPVLVLDGLAEQQYAFRTEDVGVGVEDGETIGVTTAVGMPVRDAVWDTVADASSTTVGLLVDEPGTDGVPVGVAVRAGVVSEVR